MIPPFWREMSWKSIVLMATPRSGHTNQILFCLLFHGNKSMTSSCSCHKLDHVAHGTLEKQGNRSVSLYVLCQWTPLRSCRKREEKKLHLWPDMVTPGSSANPANPPFQWYCGWGRNPSGLPGLQPVICWVHVCGWKRRCWKTVQLPGGSGTSY